MVSAVLYSGFAFLPLTQLVVADVLLYALALSLEFAALVALRVRGPMSLMLGVVALSLAGGDYSARAVLAALLAAGVGPVVYLGTLRPRPAGRT